jgi:hypothetical protein
MLQQAARRLQQKSAEAGLSGAALRFFQGKLSIDIAKVLEAVREKGLPALYEFIKGTFGSRKARQATVSAAEVRHSGSEILDQLQAEEASSASQTSSGVADQPREYPIYATGEETADFDVDIDDDGSVDAVVAAGKAAGLGFAALAWAVERGHVHIVGDGAWKYESRPMLCPVSSRLAQTLSVRRRRADDSVVAFVVDVPGLVRSLTAEPVAGLDASRLTA